MLDEKTLIKMATIQLAREVELKRRNLLEPEHQEESESPPDIVLLEIELD